MINFLTRNRIFKNKISAGMPAPYLFDIVAILLFFGAYLGFQDIHDFDTRAKAVSVPANAFALIGCVGIYGIRIATWIAILRRNRMPQTVEWLVSLLPLGATLLCFVFSGTMVRAYATSHHYHACGEQQDHGTLYVYAAPSSACPSSAQPPGSTRS